MHCGKAYGVAECILPRHIVRLSDAKKKNVFFNKKKIIKNIFLNKKAFFLIKNIFFNEKYFFKEKNIFLTIVQIFFYFFLYFCNLKRGNFNTLECLFCYSYYILRIKTLHELYLRLMTHEDVRVSEVRQTDDSDKVSEVGHVGQDVGEADDELSEIDDNEISEADIMSVESHETDE